MHFERSLLHLPQTSTVLLQVLFCVNSCGKQHLVWLVVVCLACNVPLSSQAELQSLCLLARIDASALHFSDSSDGKVESKLEYPMALPGRPRDE